MKVFITGGAGFIGVNSAAYFSKKGYDVVIFDNLSRIGTEKNLEWIKKQDGNIIFIKGDTRNSQDCVNALETHKNTDLILHLAGQVAVTTSVIDPRDDFYNNAVGTFNILEAVRQHCPKAFLIYASTNKVYGKMDDLSITETAHQYVFSDLPAGITEERPLDFYSPYGCSKGCADQYVRDYSRIYGLHTVVFRQSCIYGTRQFGIEDQGWVAWFTIAAITGRQITVYGNGKQVRDVLFVEDLVKAYEMAFEESKTTSGKIYNIGGGPNKSMSLLELLSYLEKFLGKKIDLKYSNWRAGDQKVYISSIDKAKKDFGWQPKVKVEEGVKILKRWVNENNEMISSCLGGI